MVNKTCKSLNFLPSDSLLLVNFFLDLLYAFGYDDVALAWEIARERSFVSPAWYKPVGTQ